MPEALKFQTNIPEEIALQFLDGLDVEGRSGPQKMFTLTDGRKLYVYPTLAAKIAKLGIGTNERFTICKREMTVEGKQCVEWEVARIDPPAKSDATIATPTPFATAAAANGYGLDDRNYVSGPAGLRTDQSQLCLQQLLGTIEIVHAAEVYAALMGRPVTFTSEDVRAIAISCFIQQSKCVTGGRS